jgi:hypothetical protein
MDPDKRAKLVAMETDAMETDETPPMPPPAPVPPAQPLPPRALAYLDGPTDEHRVAGLLLLAAADAAALQAHASAIAAKLDASNFLARLLKTAGDDGAALTGAQRAGLEVARALAATSADVRYALANGLVAACGACLLSVADARTMATRGDGVTGGSADDAAASVLCLDALVRGDPRRLVQSGVDGAPLLIFARDDAEVIWPAATRLLKCCCAGGGLDDQSVQALTILATTVRAKADTYAREAPLVECLALAVAARAGAARTSSTAAHARKAARDVVEEAVPRLLRRGGAGEAQRDAALGAAAVCAAGARGAAWLWGKDGAVVRVVAGCAAAEARLALDEALALATSPATIASQGRAERCLRMAPLCLGVLERVLRLLLGDDEADGSDDEGEDAPTPQPDAILGCRDAVRDAADAALGFCGEARLQQQAAARGLPEAPAPAALDLLLTLCRPALSLLGLLAAELDKDEPDAGDGDGLALHARLADLQPFVDDLVAADRGRAAPPAAPAGDEDSAASSEEEGDSDGEVDYGT